MQLTRGLRQAPPTPSSSVPDQRFLFEGAVLFICCLHMRVCVFNVFTSVCGSEVDIRCPPQSMFRRIFFSLLLNLELTSLARSKGLLLLRPQPGGYKHVPPHVGDPNSCTHDYRTATLPTLSPPQSTNTFKKFRGAGSAL